MDERQEAVINPVLNGRDLVLRLPRRSLEHIQRRYCLLQEQLAIRTSICNAMVLDKRAVCIHTVGVIVDDVVRIDGVKDSHHVADSLFDALGIAQQCPLHHTVCRDIDEVGTGMGSRGQVYVAILTVTQMIVKRLDVVCNQIGVGCLYILLHQCQNGSDLGRYTDFPVPPVAEQLALFVFIGSVLVIDLIECLERIDELLLERCILVILGAAGRVRQCHIVEILRILVEGIGGNRGGVHSLGIAHVITVTREHHIRILHALVCRERLLCVLLDRAELGLDDCILIHLCIAGQILAMVANQRIGRFLRIHRALGFIRGCCLAVIGDCQRGCHTGVEQHGRKQNARNQFLHSPTKHLSFSFLTDRISMCTGYY